MSGLKERLGRLRAAAAGRTTPRAEADGAEAGWTKAGGAGAGWTKADGAEGWTETGWTEAGGAGAGWTEGVQEALAAQTASMSSMSARGGRQAGGPGEPSTGGANTDNGIARKIESDTGDRHDPSRLDAGGEQDRLHSEFRRLGVREMANEAGTFLLRRAVYPSTHRHGRHRLGDLPGCAPHLYPLASRQNGGKAVTGSSRQSRSADKPANEHLLADPAGGVGDRRADPAAGERLREASAPTAQSLLFLDTETTGLGVGAGNVPFMIGIGTWTEQGFVVEQGLIRHPGEERAMLVWLSGKFEGVTHLVTYNGRSFDWPVLESRFILNGWRRTGAAPGHLDFLHPSRALWRNTLPSCRLSTVEEQRLGIVRSDDVPGSLAPELYMRFLQDGDLSHVGGVFIHNELDVLTLASMAVHFGHLLSGGLGSDVPDPVDAEERFRTGAWLERHGRLDDARRMYDLLAEEAGSPSTAAQAQGRSDWPLALADKYKRMGHWARALPLWEQAAAEAESARLPRLDAHTELAMYYEHRAKDYETALNYAIQALALLQRRGHALRMSSPTSREERARLERRVDRLQRKLERQNCNACGQLSLM